MVKQVALLISLSLLLLTFLTDATTIRTTTVVEEEEVDDNKETSIGTCTQIPRSRELRTCIDYVKQAAQQGGGGGYDNVGVFDCCREIKKVEKECVCDALKKVIRKSHKQGQFKEEDVSKMTRRAQNIPNLCRMGPQGCDWSSVRIGMF